MNYIEHLTEKEINTLCNIISGKKFKKLFEKDEQNFSKKAENSVLGLSSF